MIAIAITLAAAVAPVVIPFAPPVGRPVLFETEQVRQTAAGPQRYRMVNRLDFARMPDGWRLTQTLVDVSANARADAAALYDASMRPFIGVGIEMMLDATGRPVRVLNADAAWARIVAALRISADALVARNGGQKGTVGATVDYFEQFAGLTGAARDAKLTETAEQLIGFALPALRPGESAPWTVVTDGGTDAGGTIRLTGASGMRADYEIRTRTPLPEDRAIDDLTTTSIDRATGLVTASRSEKRLGDALLATETVRRVP